MDVKAHVSTTLAMTYVVHITVAGGVITVIQHGIILQGIMDMGLAVVLLNSVRVVQEIVMVVEDVTVEDVTVVEIKARPF
jgi:uncharacterized membrane protein